MAIKVEDMAIKAGKAHSLLVDTVFPYAFGISAMDHSVV
jgi:hypothetical protein